MAPFTSQQQAENQFQLRLLLAFAGMLLGFIILAARFAWLQVYQHEHFATLAQNNSITLSPIIPNRGLIIDRNGVVLAQNYSAYTLELTPYKIEDLNRTLAQLGELVELNPRDIKRFRKQAEESRNFESIALKIKLTDDEVAKVSANIWRFPGVEVKARLFRDYPFKEITAHVIGYIGRINQKEMERLEENDELADYRGSTHIGKTGLEYTYEKVLHGTAGFEEMETDAGGRPVRTLRRSSPINGHTLKLALDIELQKFAWERFGERRGALVALDPATGGVLAFISKPGYDPNLFIDGIDSQSWKDLNDDWKKPLVNRALRGLYPPGSTFKPFMAMAALETKFRDPNYTIPDPGYFSLPGSTHRFRDSKPSGWGSMSMFRSIQVSSDTYYYKLAWDMGIDRLEPQLAKFGFGSPTGIDLDGEARGVLPSKEWKRKRFAGKRYPEAARVWTPADVVPIGIGQGYNTYTPLQVAHAVAILANNGVVYRPHVVKEIENLKTGEITKVEPNPVRDNHPDPANIAFVKSAMEAVLKPGGTAARIGAGLSYRMAGKTGTAQVVQIKQGAKYNAAALAEQHRDHSWFVAFAPVEAPRIAIAVIVENGGWGASAAAPLAREVADFYLTGRKGEVSAPNSDAPSAQHVRADKNKPAAAPAEEVVE